MHTKVVKAEFAGHSLLATNAWGFDKPSFAVKAEARLYIDGDLADRSDGLYAVSKSRPFLSASLVDGATTHRVDVFIRAIFRVRMKICVDGVKVAGDLR